MTLPTLKVLRTPYSIEYTEKVYTPLGWVDAEVKVIFNVYEIENGITVISENKELSQIEGTYERVEQSFTVLLDRAAFFGKGNKYIVALFNLSNTRYRNHADAEWARSSRIKDLYIASHIDGDDHLLSFSEVSIDREVRARLRSKYDIGVKSRNALAYRKRTNDETVSLITQVIPFLDGDSGFLGLDPHYFQPFSDFARKGGPIGEPPSPFITWGVSKWFPPTEILNFLKRITAVDSKLTFIKEPTNPETMKIAKRAPKYRKPLSSTTQTQGEPTQMTQMNDKFMIELLAAIKSLKEDVKKSSPLEEKLLEAVIERTKDIATAELETELKGKLDKFIALTYGVLPKRVDIVINKELKHTLSGIFHSKFNDILTMLANNMPVMITGPAGAGKNFTLEQAAKALNLDFYYTGSITQEYKITGFIDANGRYHETEFYKAFKNGGLFMLDEVDASSPETLILLNAAIANRYFDFPNGRINAHENFRVACAGNTYGTGADMVYVGRNVLDGATLDRFVVITMDYDKNVETKLCPDEEFLRFIHNVRETVNKTKIRHIIGMRATINGYKSILAGMSKAFIIESIIMKGLGVDDVNVIIKSLNDSTSWSNELRDYAKSLGGAK